MRAAARAAGRDRASVPTVPPIPLKFIGRVVMPDKSWSRRFGREGNNVLTGTEGQVIDGRYRIIRIGEESVIVEP